MAMASSAIERPSTLDHTMCDAKCRLQHGLKLCLDLLEILLGKVPHQLPVAEKDIEAQYDELRIPGGVRQTAAELLRRHGVVEHGVRLDGGIASVREGLVEIGEPERPAAV